MRKTKIVCTLGPATDDYATLKKLVRAGMSVARLNMSHGSYDEHTKRMEMVKKARIKFNKIHKAVLSISRHCLAYQRKKASPKGRLFC